MKTVLTHDGDFHADEVCAIAILKIVYPKIKVIRSRDLKKHSKANIFVDVGLKYDPKKNYFDHHQIKGAGKRKNNIPYSSAGLVWKHFGKKITKSKDVFEMIDQRLIQTIDAEDNGIQMQSSQGNFIPYTLSSIIFNFGKFGSKNDVKIFNEAVNLIKVILEREISYLEKMEKDKKIVQKIIKKSVSKEYVVLDRNYNWFSAVEDFPKLKYVISPKSNGYWSLKAVDKKGTIFNCKKLLPKSWAGLNEKEFEEICGVKDVLFCHKNLFLVVAKFKESVIKLAELAIKA